ncbi:MAG: TetR/AcrR family transcriptional regulator [Myxococcaceae bacterium]
MSLRPSMSPRKLPRQDRAKATVDAILKATARILVKEGYEATSTNRVALAAGVSVGSLYQYFPSKEALILAVMERHVDAILGRLQSRLIELIDEPLEKVARELVHELIEAHRVNPKLHQVLIQQVPRMGKLTCLDEVDHRLAQLVCAYLTAHRDEVDVENPELTAYVIVKAAEAVTHSVINERPELLDNGGLEKELVRLILSYVR